MKKRYVLASLVLILTTVFVAKNSYNKYTYASKNTHVENKNKPTAKSTDTKSSSTPVKAVSTNTGKKPIITESDKDKYMYNVDFKDYVVFYPQHEDDEVLWGGSAIKRAINTRGADHVFVVLASDGTGVNLFNKAEYKSLNRAQRAQLRFNEFDGALEKLGVPKENILKLANLDTKPGTHYELMRKVALDFENKYKSVTHIAHSYKYDDHPLHKENGLVIKKLFDEGQIKDARFFLKPRYRDQIPEKERYLYTVESKDDYDAVYDSLMQYKVITKEPRKDGLGYVSAHSYFDALFNDPKLPSILHTPNI